LAETALRSLDFPDVRLGCSRDSINSVNAIPFRRSNDMRQSLYFAALSLLGVVLAHAQANPALFRCKDQRHLVDLSINDSGKMLEGPACAQIIVNALRYSADFGKTVSYTGGANLPSIFPSSFSAGGAQPPKVEILDEHFNADFRNIQQLQGQLLAIEVQNRKTGAGLDKYLATLRALISQTDEILRAGGAKGVVTVVKGAATQNQMDDILHDALNWQTTDEIVARLLRVQADLNALPLLFPANTGTVTGDPCTDANRGQLGWTDWSKCRDTQFKAAQSMVTAALTEAGPWVSDGDKVAQFAKKVGIVRYWQTTIAALTEDSFTLQAEVRCGVLFNRNEQTILKLILVDRTSVFDGQPGSPQIKDGLLTVTCSSPFTVSAGAAFSTIRNKQFAIVKSVPPSGTTSLSTFGVTSDSRVNPYPVAMAHARLRDWRDNRYALHFSFGVGANIKGDASGGSNPEFLTGLSISFLRTIFVTGGLDVGKQSELIGGFKVGDPVPTDITSPPVSSSYKAGFGFTITFTKP
jgi:hypothetical protein